MSFSNTQDRLRQGQTSGNRQSLKDSFVDLKVNKDVTEKEICIRLIGLPFAFFQYQPRKLDAATKKRIEVDFPDQDEKPKFTRNWVVPGEEDDRYPSDPWSAAGYVGSLRYAQNCLLRHDDGTFEVKILEKGKMLFDEFTNFEELNRRRADSRPGKKYVTCLGAEESHDLLVVAQFNPKKPLVADLKVSPEPELVTITEEEIEALKKVGMPTEEELEELFSRNPELEELPAWFWYGYQIPRIYKPDMFPGMEAPSSSKTSRGELDMSDATNDDDEPAAAAPAAEKTKAAPKAAKAGATTKAAATEDNDEAAFGGDTDTPSDEDW
ncbi:MAG: hypothetical protein JSS66_05295 [Armatimonadetes bacterium]|nr:hypothetical protein [Armatimonadota bacterium]